MTTRSAGGAPEGRGAERKVGGEPPVGLVLYLAPQSPASARARRNLEELLHDYDETQVTLTVRDVAADADHAEADRVIFTPTLVIHIGGAVARVVGDLMDLTAVTNVLTMGGLEKRL